MSKQQTLVGTSYTFVEISTFDCPALMVVPKFNELEIKTKVNEWFNKQDAHWPSALTVDYLLQNLLCVNLPYWLMNAEGSGQWSAQIGREVNVEHKCNTCNGTGTYYLLTGGSQTCTDCGGKGRIIRTETNWTSQSGVCSGGIREEIEENFDLKNNPPLRCGKRDFKASTTPLQSRGSQLLFLPLNLSQSAAQSVAQEHVERAISRDGDRQASGLGQVRNFRLGLTQIHNLNVSILLYPIYISSYLFEEKTHLIEMDAVTGTLYIQVPDSIKSARFKAILKRIAPFIAALVVLVLVVALILVLTRSR
jgi:hypothetical protein